MTNLEGLGYVFPHRVFGLLQSIGGLVVYVTTNQVAQEEVHS
jgi:hypothetical protein